MELEKIERLKELIQKRDSLLKDLKRIEMVIEDVDARGLAPNTISIERESEYIVTINIPWGKKCEILKLIEDLYKEELEKTNNLIKEL